MTDSHLIVHLCTRAAWQAALTQGSYQADSLDTIGFIHLSRPEQIQQVANAFYPNLSDAVLLWINPALLIAELRWEKAEDGLFPHLYGPLNLEAVVAVTDFHIDADLIYPF
jgi:uncharacterized protein (DUF952 family)